MRRLRQLQRLQLSQEMRVRGAGLRSLARSAPYPGSGRHCYTKRMIYVLYRSGSEHERDVMEFKQRLQARRLEVSLVDADSRQGADKAQAYGIMQYPAVLAVREGTGQALQTWFGTLPTVSDVEFYARSSV